MGFPGNTHSVAPFCDIILVERANDDVGSYATSIPFLRGAATQFNIKFGIDLSLWWGVIDGCVGSSNSMPGKLHERIMYVVFECEAREFQLYQFLMRISKISLKSRE